MGYANSNYTDTICAIATAPGSAAQGVIKVSGSDAVEIVSKLFIPTKKGVELRQAPAYSAYYGWIIDPKTNERIDDAIALFLRAPHSYTGEDQVELSCHGSSLILKLVLNLLVEHGARLAEAGEFTRRAFSNGKMDLSQAEAVADVIASTNRAALRMSLTQMRGGFRQRIEELRKQLIHFASLIELELDFSEEDVEFVDRQELLAYCTQIKEEVDRLHDSYQTGEVIKNGIPIAIAGSTNAGKSTLLNTLLQEERAIVSDIHGTTRDYIEDHLFINGKEYRLVDTAGLRETSDTIEGIGIERSFQKVSEAELTLWVIDAQNTTPEELSKLLQSLLSYTEVNKIVPVFNKIDVTPREKIVALEASLKQHQLTSPLHIVAKERTEVEKVRQLLSDRFQDIDVAEDDIIVSNLRQATALKEASNALGATANGLQLGLSGDLLAQDIRSATRALGEVIGTVTTDDLLQNIFAHFCIGK